jgi:hypothetical protein
MLRESSVVGRSSSAQEAHEKDTHPEPPLPSFAMSELKLLGGEPCLLDRTVEINGVETLLAALTAEEKTAALVDPSMAIRHFRACKVGLAEALSSLSSVVLTARGLVQHVCMPT